MKSSKRTSQNLTPARVPVKTHLNRQKALLGYELYQTCVQHGRLCILLESKRGKAVCKRLMMRKNTSVGRVLNLNKNEVQVKSMRANNVMEVAKKK